MRIIIVNVAIFIIARIAGIIFMLFNSHIDTLLQWLQLPSNPQQLLHRPWTLFSYMFLQYDIAHILFNMLWLYWLGRIFVEFFTQKQLFGLYVLGGLGGAILYVVMYNVFPYYAGVNSFLLGASASVMAIVVATAMYSPNYKINLLFLGAISLKWIAAFVVFIDILQIDSTNSGGHIAHLGGAVVGAIYTTLYRRGTDITSGFNRIFDSTHNMFSKLGDISFTRKSIKKVKHNKEYKKTKPDTTSPTAEAEMDIILEKIKRSGYSSLTTDEKKRLFNASNKLN
ncbi:MAG: rhomboid family intramembrane serine protease [Bacteroidales bacterium]